MNRFEQKVKELLDAVDPSNDVDKFEAVRALGRGIAVMSVIGATQRARRSFLQCTFDGITLDADDCLQKYAANRASRSDTPIPDDIAAEAYTLLDQIFTRAGANKNG